MKNKNTINTVSATILALFALLTLFLSSSIIFDWFGIRAKEGNYVLFIVWANFIVSILYLIAAYGFIKGTKWPFWVLIVTLAILVIAFFGLKVHIDNGGVYEAKTVKAMIFRLLFTLTFTLIALVRLNKSLWKL